MKFEEYEFNQYETEIIWDLSKNMRFVGIFLIVMSVLSLLGGSWVEWRLDSNIFGGIGYIFWGILNLLIGFWTFKAATYFKRIVDDRGDDMKNLMDGFGKVSQVYELQRWFFSGVIIFFVLSILLVVLAFFLALA
ncbi:MAG TPA: hypothetical protein V6D11_30340 [Waterburya sp.]